jgi:Kef-type K+ transport system membrane component KefB
MTPQPILVILLLSAVILTSPFIARSLRAPLAVIEILIGSAIGYFGLFKGVDFLPLIAKTGFLFLMFLAGMEVNLKAFLSIRRPLLLRALAYFTILYSLSGLIVWYFSLPLIYLVAFPIVSLGMIMALIKELGKDEPWLKLVLLIGILGELISIVALTLLSGGLRYGFGWDFAQAIAILVAFLLLSALLFRVAKIYFWWFPNVRKILMPDQDATDQGMRISFALFFMMIAMVLYLGLDVVLGAFIAGMFIATFFPHNHELHHKLSSVGFGVLVPIFFVYVGSTLSFSALSNENILSQALTIVGILVLLRAISSLVYLSHLGAKNTFLLALGDSMPLTFLLAVATIGKEANAINDVEYYALIIAGMIAAITMMSLIKLITNLSSKKR